MKTKAIILLLFVTATVSKAQLNELTGTWTVFELSNEAGQNSSKLTEDQFKSNGLLLDYSFMENGRFSQTGNLADESNGAVTTQEGTWKTMDNKLIVTLEMGGNKVDLDYTWELKDKNLILTRTWPGMKVIMLCRKKS
jgi:hypothetical protein